MSENGTEQNRTVCNHYSADAAIEAGVKLYLNCCE